MDERRLAQHVCGVLTPFKVATRVMESGREQGFASCYLPMWLGVMQALRGGVPRPRGAGQWGEEATTSKYLTEDLVPLARRLQSWLAADMDLQMTKHIGGDSATMLILRAAAFLDPRHKKLLFLEEPQRKKVQKWVKTEAFRMAEKDPEYKKQAELNRKKAEAERLAKQAEAADPDQMRSPCPIPMLGP